MVGPAQLDQLPRGMEQPRIELQRAHILGDRLVAAALLLQ